MLFFAFWLVIQIIQPTRMLKMSIAQIYDEKLFIGLVPVSVTNWFNFVFNLWQFTKKKICQMSQKFANVV